MWVGKSVDAQGEHLLLDEAVAVVHLDGFSDQGDRDVGG